MAIHPGDKYLIESFDLDFEKSADDIMSDRYTIWLLGKITYPLKLHIAEK
jgi:hypothetical protein